MKKTVFLVFCLCLVLSLASCSKGKKKGKSDFTTFSNNVVTSESTFTSYVENSSIKDGEAEIYTKTIEFKIDRGTEEVKTSWNQVETKLSSIVSSSGSNYETKKSSYITIGTTKYDTTYGLNTESTFVVPSYFLTFTLNENYFDSFTITKEDSTTTLTGKVKNEEIGSFFLGKSLTGLSELSIEIVVSDSKLSSFKADYTTPSGLLTSLETTYDYSAVSIQK